MGFQWTLAASMLYVEGVVALLLCIPLISSTRWQKFFKLKLLQRLAAFCTFGFWCAVVFQIVLFIDAYQTMKKYEDRSESSHDKENFMAIHENHLNLFRAQRNVYISGFALFLLIVIYRLQRLISSNAILSVSNEAFKRQAESASKAAEKFMADNEMLKTQLKQVERRAGPQPSAPPERSSDDEDDAEIVDRKIGSEGPEDDSKKVRHRGKGSSKGDENETSSKSEESTGDKKDE